MAAPARPARELETPPGMLPGGFFRCRGGLSSGGDRREWGREGHLFELDPGTVALVAAVALTAALGVYAGHGRKQRRLGARQRPPTGVGAALALALEGDLAEARNMLQHLIRAGGVHRADAIVGLVAVLRASGETERAEALVERLVRACDEPWVHALRVRLALDAGHLQRAAARAEAPGVPTDLAVAALARAGKWDAAWRRYRSDVGRKTRAPSIESTLLAGRAAAAARSGDLRSARRDLKRALAADEQGVAALAVGARLHAKPAERARLAARLDALLSGRADAGETSGGGTSISSADEVEGLLERARQRFEAGEREVALGMVRDHLDRHPDAWSARRQYAQWMLDHGEPADWRAELAELLHLLPEAEEADAAACRCTACGFVAGQPLFVCPRCDALGTLRPDGDDRRLDAVPPSEAGARLDELVGGLGPAGSETAS